MITYLSLSTRNRLQAFLRNWAPTLRHRVRFLSYSDLPAPASLPDGTYIFADLEQLPPSLVAPSLRLWDELASRTDRVRLLNHPRRSMRRFELLRSLHEMGDNRFNALKLDEPRHGLRFPVFVRDANAHTGALTPLLNTTRELSRGIDSLVKRGSWPEDLLIVEFVDTKDRRGLYRKYSAMHIGHTTIPHHIMFGPEWQVKGPSLVEPWMLKEERDFQTRNPHRERLERVFERARIDYGRIDYGMAGNEIQVWEINTNPTFLYSPNQYQRSQMPGRKWISNEVKRALKRLDDKSPSPLSVGMAFRSVLRLR